MRVLLPHLLNVEEENFDGGPAWPVQPHIWVVSSKRYGLYLVPGPGLSLRHQDGRPVVVEPTREQVRQQTEVRVVKPPATH